MTPALLAAPAAALHGDAGAHGAGAQLRGQAVLLTDGSVRGVVELRQEHGGRTAIIGILIGRLLAQADGLQLGVAPEPCSAGAEASRYTPTGASFHGNASDFTGLSGVVDAGRRLDRIASVAVIASGFDDGPHARLVACGDLAGYAVRPRRHRPDVLLTSAGTVTASPAFFAQVTSQPGGPTVAAAAFGGLRPGTAHTLSASPRSCDGTGGAEDEREAIVGFVTDGAGTAALRDDVLDVLFPLLYDARSLVVTEGTSDGPVVSCAAADPVAADRLDRGR